MSTSKAFQNRFIAGEQLGETLKERVSGVEIVLAIPRGGLPVGRAVADILGVPLDIVVAAKIGAPGHSELAMGAVASDGTVWRNKHVFDGSDRDEEYFKQQQAKEAEYARQKAARYRDERPAPDLTGKIVAVVDDGVATGATARACLLMLRESGADRVILAVPVGPPDTIAELQELADEVICEMMPTHFRAVGQYYKQFGQVSDHEAITYL